MGKSLYPQNSTTMTRAAKAPGTGTAKGGGRGSSKKGGKGYT